VSVCYFLSYAHEDWDGQIQLAASSFFDELDYELKRRLGDYPGRLSFRDSRALHLGDEWQQEARVAVQDAHVLIALCSPCFRASEPCAFEVQVCEGEMIPLLWLGEKYAAASVPAKLQGRVWGHRELPLLYRNEGLKGVLERGDRQAWLDLRNALAGAIVRHVVSRRPEEGRTPGEAPYFVDISGTFAPGFADHAVGGHTGAGHGAASQTGAAGPGFAVRAHAAAPRTTVPAFLALGAIGLVCATALSASLYPMRYSLAREFPPMLWYGCQDKPLDQGWLVPCGKAYAGDSERQHRFFEQACQLDQAEGCARDAEVWHRDGQPARALSQLARAVELKPHADYARRRSLYVSEAVDHLLDVGQQERAFETCHALPEVAERNTCRARSRPRLPCATVIHYTSAGRTEEEQRADTQAAERIEHDLIQAGYKVDLLRWQDGAASAKTAVDVAGPAEFAQSHLADLVPGAQISRWADWRADRDACDVRIRVAPAPPERGILP